MADSADFDRFFHPSPAHPADDVFAAERAFAATPPLDDAARLHAPDLSWSHVPLPAGVLHPALHDVAGARPCTLVPVAPPSLRPLVRGAGGRPIENAVDARLRQLMRRAAVTRHLVERDAGDAIVGAARGALQQAFDALVRQLDDGDSLWTPAPDEAERLRPAGAPAPAAASDVEEARRPLDCAVAADRLLLVLPTAVVALDRAGGVVATHAASGLRLAHAGDGVARFSDDERAYAWSLADGRWLDAWPPRGALFVASQYEESRLVDAARGRVRELFEVAEAPAIARISPDGAFAWVADAEDAGGIFDAENGLRQWTADELRATPSDDDDTWERAWEPGAPDHAFALTADERLRLFTVDTLHAGGAAHRLPPAHVAAFSVDARELLCADGEELRLYALAADDAAPTLRLRLPLAPIVDAALRTES